MAYVENGKPSVTEGRNCVAEQSYADEKEDCLIWFVPKHRLTSLSLKDVDAGNNKGCATKGDG